jgi:hypothetical protein
MIQTILVVRAKHIPLSPSLQRFACAIHKSPLLNVRFAFHIKKALKPAAERISYPQPHVPIRITISSTAMRQESKIQSELMYIIFLYLFGLSMGRLLIFLGQSPESREKVPGTWCSDHVLACDSEVRKRFRSLFFLVLISGLTQSKNRQQPYCGDGVGPRLENIA